MARKKRRGGRRRSHARRSRRAGGGGKWSMNKKDLLIAGGTLLGYGYLQSRASKAKGDEMKFFKEMPVVTPLGRAGTMALAAGAAYAVGGVRLAKPITFGLVGAFLLGFGRRGLEPYDDAANKDVLAGGDEMYLEGDEDEMIAAGAVELIDGNGDASDWDEAAAVLEAAA